MGVIIMSQLIEEHNLRLFHERGAKKEYGSKRVNKGRLKNKMYSNEPHILQ